MPFDGFSFAVFAISRTTRYTLRVYPSRYIFLLYRRGYIQSVTSGIRLRETAEKFKPSLIKNSTQIHFRFQFTYM
jgi:hypothetical protein